MHCQISYEEGACKILYSTHYDGWSENIQKTNGDVLSVNIHYYYTEEQFEIINESCSDGSSESIENFHVEGTKRGRLKSCHFKAVLRWFVGIFILS